MIHPLDGARERIRRADENIQNLNREIDNFLTSAPSVILDVDFDKGKPIITDKDRETFDQIADFLNNERVPPRYAVLTGEIIHHLRSAFDHVAWQLSSTDFQTNSPRQIQFPVSRTLPKPCGLTRNKISGYCGQIQGISSPSALARIDTLQPYRNGGNAERHPLWLIHDMDLWDKHRELILGVYIMQLNVVANAQYPGIGLLIPWEIRPRNTRITGPPTNVDMKAKMSIQVT